MNSEYIYIRSIEDIDPKKLTIRDLNKKFIDDQGRKYAVKFDFQTRQIQFVRIASSYQEAIRIKQEILKEKQKNVFQKEQKEILPSRFDATFKEQENKLEQENITLNKKMNDYDFLSPEEVLFDENEFFKELEKESKKSVESLRAIEKNLNRSQVFEKLSNSLNEFFDLQKEIEIKCYNASEEAIKILKELVYYPRPINHYLTRLPDPIRKKIENLNETQQFDFMKRYEIYKIFHNLIMNVMEYTNRLEKFYYQLPPIDRERKPLVDLLPSFAEIKETMEQLTQKMNLWYSQYQK
jgi:hypothetical protein